MKKISERNTLIYYSTQFFHALVFTIPIWIVYYQGVISDAQISLLVTIQYISQMVLELPSGALADLIGRRLTNFLGFVAGAGAYLLIPFASTFWHYLLLSLLMGLSDAFRSGAEEALIYDTLKQEDKMDDISIVYSKGNFIYQVGLIAATATGGFIFSINRNLPYVLYGFSLLIGALIGLFYIEPSLDSDKFTFKNYIYQMINGAKEAFKSKESSALSVFYILVAGIAWSSTLYFNGFMMVELGFNDNIRGILTAVMRTINAFAIGSILTNKRLFNFQRTVLFFPIIMLLGYLPGIFLNGYWGIPFIQAAMVATTARWIVLSPLTNAMFSSKYRATAISLLSLFIGVIYIILTSVSSYIIPVYGIKMMYSLLGVFTLVTVVPATISLLKSHKSS